MSSQQKAFASIILASILGGGIGVFVKIAITEIPVFSLTFFRFLIGSLLMLPFIIKSIKHLDKNIYKVIFICLIGTLNTVIYSFGVGKTSVTISQILYALVPIIIIIISFFLLKEKFSRKQISGIIVGFTGVCLIIINPILIGEKLINSSLFGNILVLIAILLFSFYSVLSKKLHNMYSTSELTGFFLLTSLFSQFILAPIDLHYYPSWWKSVTEIGIISTLYLGTFGLSIWYLLYQYAIKHGSPSTASLTFYLQPITTFFWAFILLGEKINIFIIIGAIITFLGLFLTTAQSKKNDS